jgi:hypothetical protein
MILQREPQSTGEIESIHEAICLAELAGVDYGGPQMPANGGGILHYFREPVTGSSIALWDSQLSLDSLNAGLKACRVRFGVEVS